MDPRTCRLPPITPSVLRRRQAVALPWALVAQGGLDARRAPLLPAAQGRDAVGVELVGDLLQGHVRRAHGRDALDQLGVILECWPAVDPCVGAAVLGRLGAPPFSVAERDERA